MSSTTTSTDPPSQTPINLTLTPQELQTLSTLAIGAKRKAYCPYSNFRVGAALIIDIDTPGQADAHLPAFHTGANVEVASTPVGTCAERCALAPVVASLERPRMPRVRAMAVSTDIWPPSSPCGMCRQMIREFCMDDMKVYMYGRQPGQTYADTLAPEDEYIVCGKPVVMTIGELLPMSFGPEDMQKRLASWA